MLKKTNRDETDDVAYRAADDDLPPDMFTERPEFVRGREPQMRTDSATRTKSPRECIVAARSSVQFAAHWLDMVLTEQEINVCVLIVAAINMQQNRPTA